MSVQSKKEANTSFRNEVILWIALAFSIILFISNFGIAGKAGTAISSVFFGLFGLIAYLFPVLLFVGLAFAISNRDNKIAAVKICAAIVFTLFLCFFLELVSGDSTSLTPIDSFLYSASKRIGGGFFGGFFRWLIVPNLGSVSAFIIDFVVLIICLILITERSLMKQIERGSRKVYDSARQESVRQKQRHEEHRQRRMDKKVVGVSTDLTLSEPHTDPMGEVSMLKAPEFPIHISTEHEVQQQEPEIVNHIMPGFAGSGELAQAVGGEVQELARVPAAAGRAMESAFVTSRSMEQDYPEGVIPIQSKKVVLQPKKASSVVSDTDSLLARTSDIFSELLFDAPQPDAHHLEAADESQSPLYTQQQEALSIDTPQLENSTDDFARQEAFQFDKSQFENFPVDESRITDLSIDESHYDASPVSLSQYEASTIADASEVDLSYSEESVPQLNSPLYAESVFAMESNTHVLRAGQPEDSYMEGTDTFDPFAEAEEMLNSLDNADDLENEVPDAKLPEPKSPMTSERKPGRLPSMENRQSKQEIAAGVTATEQQVAQQSVIRQEYVFPPTELLKKGQPGKTGDSRQHLQETALKLQQILKNFGVNVTILNVTCGPAVTRYEIQPEMGVKVSKIVNLSDDIKLNLAAADIRIEAPIPGKAAIGIEVPNKENVTVMFRELIESEEFRQHKSSCAFAVGKDIAGKVIVSDICKMPHLLIAGATGSGKSVCINTIIMSLIYKANPEDVKLIMIDPKVVELSVYNGIPHLLLPVVTDPKKAAGALHWAVSEMMDRYQKFAGCGVRDIKGYNAKVQQLEGIEADDKPQKMPYIVIIVDELADLMMVAPGDVEDAICRLAQLARAAGIHLIIATQRPSVNVITGLIKANMPSRIAFAVSSSVDSRTILDGGGAEKLLGKGDMLFYPQGLPKPVRVQGAFVDDSEVSKVVEFLTERNGMSQYNSEIEAHIATAAENGGSVSIDAGPADERDSYFADAARVLIDKDKASVSMLQRYFKIGFNRAARIMDQLEEAGVVGPEEGTKPRKILMSPEEFEQYQEEYL